MGRTLKQVKCGETVTVQKIQGEGLWEIRWRSRCGAMSSLCAREMRI